MGRLHGMLIQICIERIHNITFQYIIQQKMDGILTVAQINISICLITFLTTFTVFIGHLTPL